MSVATIADRHFRKPRARTPRPVACIGTTADPGREMHPRKPEVFGLEWLPVPPRKPITTPETALAAAAIECAVVEVLGILAVTMGVRRQYPNSIHSEEEANSAFWSAAFFLFVPGSCVYDLDVAATSCGLNVDALRARIMDAARSFDTAPVSRKPRRSPVITRIA